MHRTLIIVSGSLTLSFFSKSLCSTINYLFPKRNNHVIISLMEIATEMVVAS